MLKKTIPIVLVAIALVVGLVALFASALRPIQGFQTIQGPPEMAKVDAAQPLREQTRLFEMAGRTFKIPIMYVDSRPDDEKHQDSMLLEVIWPEMRSIWELKNRAEYERIWKTERRLGWILLEPSSIRPTLDEQTSNREKRITKTEELPTLYGLEGYAWYYGPPDEPKLWSEIYLARDEHNTIISRIECRVGPNPHCSHKFVDGGIIYQISYDKAAFLSNWREQEERTINFLREFEMENIQ